jgi:hypothetical protein
MSSYNAASVSSTDSSDTDPEAVKPEISTTTLETMLEAVDTGKPKDNEEPISVYANQTQPSDTYSNDQGPSMSYRISDDDDDGIKYH